MKANLYWICQPPGCGLLNLSQLDTAMPGLDLVCEHCGKAQGYHVVLSAIVQGAPRIRREVPWPDPIPFLPQIAVPLDPLIPTPLNRPHDVKEGQP